MSCECACPRGLLASLGHDATHTRTRHVRGARTARRTRTRHVRGAHGAVRVKETSML